LLTLNKKGKNKDAQRLSRELYKSDKYPSSILSREELQIISNYFVNKSKKTDIIPWQPSQSQIIHKESNKSPYKIFRPIIPRIEAKVLRSHKSSVSFNAALNLNKKGLKLREEFMKFRDLSKKQENKGMEQRSKILDTIHNLEDSWNNGDIGDPQRKKVLPLNTNKLNLLPFVRLQRLDSTGIKACQSLIQPAKLTYNNSSNSNNNVTTIPNITTGTTSNEFNPQMFEFDPISLPLPSLREIGDLMNSMSTFSNDKENTN
jgi:hypothetical protein